MNLQNKEAEFRKRMQLLILIAAGIVIYPFMLLDGVFPGRGFYLAEKYMAVPTLLFLGSVLTQRLNPVAKKCMLLSVAVVLWFVITQTHHWLTGMTTRHFGIFAVVYLLAFPYAAVTEDGWKSVGLKWISWFYVAYGLVMVIFAGMLLLDAVPGAFAASVKLDGARASMLSHPNGGGCILMLGIGFSLYVITQSKKKWEKYVLAVLTALEFLAQILTNSHTSILMTCALIGGTLFFKMWNGTWKRFLAGAAAALAVIVVLFSFSRVVFDLHTEAQINKLIQQQEQQTSEGESQNQNLHFDEETGEFTISGTGSSNQGTLSNDMRTLNGRTVIWKAAFTALRDNPDIRLWGTEYVAAEISYRSPFGVVNAHNSWIQILMQLGIPGFLLIVIYTLTAVRNIWILLWRKNEDLSRKVVAMTMICILGVSVLEAYLFIGGMDTIFVNFIFFLCTGYLVQWNADASAKAF